jgi:sigma-54 dependent transcriptional regulator, acetoin dehydrogenase operon transcriptional activator AcoR
VFGLSSLIVSEPFRTIQASWKRCQDGGLNSLEHAYDQIITGRKIKEIISNNHELVNSTRPIFEKLASFLKQCGYIALLSDSVGNIIYTEGDLDFANRAQKVQLQVGANWHEEKKGTNAIGVALIERRPVSIHGDQHFFIENHFLTCTSSPVYSSTGELLGVVNISGRHEINDPHLLTVACLTADSLQNKLLWEQSQKEQILTLKELEFTSNKLPLPIVALDADMQVIRANSTAIKMLGKDCIGKTFQGKKGFVVETLHDGRKRNFRSVAIYQPEKKEETAVEAYEFKDIMGSCPQFIQTKRLAEKAALSDFPILLLGESGTGKELFAQAIHSGSFRSHYPFIAVNCSAIPESLVESELFGYEAGAFTGANREGGLGKFSAANNGTIFLDEIGDMSLRAQAALLRVLQEKRVTPVGSVLSRQINVRVIAATHRDLRQEIEAGRFRLDLYYRLRGLQITIPPLRGRTDILELASYLFTKINGSPAVFSEEAQALLKSYSWPGNVRELHSLLIQASFLAEGSEIRPEHLGLEGQFLDSNEQGISLLKETEMATIKNTLLETGWNISKTAKRLQISRNTLYRKMEEYQIEKKF